MLIEFSNESANFNALLNDSSFIYAIKMDNLEKQ